MTGCQYIIRIWVVQLTPRRVGHHSDNADKLGTKQPFACAQPSFGQIVVTQAPS